MLTTIFTGHTLDLSDIVAIGPLIQDREFFQNGVVCRRKLTFSIFCRQGAVLPFEDNKSKQEVFGEIRQEQIDEWVEFVAVLEAQRNDLIQQWEMARGAIPADYGNSTLIGDLVRQTMDEIRPPALHDRSISIVDNL